MRKSSLPTCWPARTQGRTSGHCAQSGHTQHSRPARTSWGDERMQVTLAEHSAPALEQSQRAPFSIILETCPWRLTSPWRDRARCLQPLTHTTQLGSRPTLFPTICYTLAGEQYLSGSQFPHLLPPSTGCPGTEASNPSQES